MDCMQQFALENRLNESELNTLKARERGKLLLSSLITYNIFPQSNI